MTRSSSLRITTPSDRELAMTRSFNAPRQLVFDAHTKPHLVKRWLLGPPGWTMPVCEIDLRVGGRYRYVWRNEEGVEMGMGGAYREILPPERLVASEVFDEPWYPGEAIVSTVFVELGGRTTLTTTVRYESKEARDGVLRSGMEQGVEASYDRLQAVLEENAGATPEPRAGAAFSATLAVRDWAAAVAFYKAAFGAVETYVAPGGGVARLAADGAEFWVAEESKPHQNFSPESLGGCSVRLLLLVADPAAVCDRAVEAGATLLVPVADAHGWRIGRIVDPAGHHWEVATELA